MIKRLALISAIGFFLAACAGFGTFTNPVTKSKIDALNASWGSTLAIFNGYKDACAQRLIPSSCRSVVIYLQPRIEVVQGKVEQARVFAAKPTLSAVDVIAVASDAVNDFKLLQSEMGVK